MQPTLPIDNNGQNVASLDGTLERIVFHNEENGYSVLRFKTTAGDNYTVVGNMADPQVGSSLKLTGEWVENAKFGRQFKMLTYETSLPAGVVGIRHYLASGLIKGVGPKTAERIVDAFGEDTFAILDNEPERLSTVKGIGKRTAKGIQEAWSEHRGIRDLIMFLQPHGVSTAYAVRIYKFYGKHALSVVQENPYRLAMDINGIGFVTADTIAQKIGFDVDSPLRAEAGTLYMLTKTSDEGHVYFPLDALVTKTSDTLNIRADLVEDAIDTLEREERVVVEELSNGQVAVYRSRFYAYETGISTYIKKILGSPKTVLIKDPDELVDEVVEGLGIDLAEEQLAAVHMAVRTKMMVLTGGPGTGKTTITKAIVQAYKKLKAKILLCAPTGRAAKRMFETIGVEAKTIHRLLEYSPREDGFQRNENNPLACSLIVIDEASMMDTMLMFHLLKAIPLGATVIFVGDVHQLPSVGPGNVLKDVISSGVVDVTELHEVFRQAQESDIITNAHKINAGEVPFLESSKERLSDFYFIRQDDPERCAAMIVDLVKNHIPRRFRFDPIDQIQVLTPMHKGSAGSGNLNHLLQQALNPQPLCLKRGDREYRLDDKVMQLRNNYDKDVFNGDIGRICVVNTEEKKLTVRFDDEKNVIYDFNELDELVPAYAISIHKSQGSEYQAVVIPVLTQHYVLLQRNLIYTGVTRGKKLVILVGASKALTMAIKNNKMQKRFTYLSQRLSEFLQ
ncbi:SF1B family DNA helicase RecD2 [Halodesulfovibrio marinisediminis]|uniref:Exodeoxyribonuclease V alpha subunit n=1 Tax=Halodesulfovibrio marinisediminis DSM 17456 TaxID=1121457 RepID=A0A1N6IJW8_9BACT|nr:ATP-dependent RecD-like DNA helicase [Halodesulfovibrio marinisediminis]SIO32330.1 exodeoxyribonuclease V alpha subunit [Halodesulfovibrio marinisediminis DSM 17456]